MSNKTNDLRYQKNVTLRNSDNDFREKAQRVESKTPIGSTSGMGNENYYYSEGKAYNSYTEAVNDLDKK